jgi:hypothetical protein
MEVVQYLDIRFLGSFGVLCLLMQGIYFMMPFKDINAVMILLVGTI